MNEPCARCGHTLYEHSTGECDLKGCTCKGWCATAVMVDDYDDDYVFAVGAAGAVFAAGLVIGVFIGGLL